MTNPTMSYDYEYIKALLHDENVVFQCDLKTMLAEEMHFALLSIGEHEWTDQPNRFYREWTKMSNQWIDRVGMRPVFAYTWDDVGAVFEDVDKDVLMRYVRDETKFLFDRKHVAHMLVYWQRWSDQRWSALE